MSLGNSNLNTNSIPVIPDDYTLCPQCQYCLKGLHYESKCPECGFPFIYEVPTIAEAVNKFVLFTPKHWRFWLIPHSDLSRCPWHIIILTIILSGLITVSYLLLHYAIIYVAVYFPTSKLPTGSTMISTMFGEIGWFGPRLYLLTDSVIAFGVILFFGQVLLSMLIWAWYTISCRFIYPHKQVTNYLGIYASMSVPMMSIFPLCVSVLWHYIDVRHPSSTSFSLLRSLYPIVNPFRSGAIDWFDVIGTVIMLILIVIISAKFYMHHRRCIFEIKSVFLGVRRRTD